MALERTMNHPEGLEEQPIRITIDDMQQNLDDNELQVYIYIYQSSDIRIRFDDQGILATTLLPT